MPPTQSGPAGVLGAPLACVAQLLTLLTRASALVDGAVDLAAPSSLYLHNHRPPLWPTHPWYGLDDQHGLVRRVLEEAARRDVVAAVSADRAPNLVAPSALSVEHGRLHVKRPRSRACRIRPGDETR